MPSNPIIKTRGMQRVEQRVGQPLEQYLADEYQSKTTAQIGEAIGLSQEGVARWMREFGIELRLHGQRPPKAVA